MKAFLPSFAVLVMSFALTAHADEPVRGSTFDLEKWRQEQALRQELASTAKTVNQHVDAVVADLLDQAEMQAQVDAFYERMQAIKRQNDSEQRKAVAQRERFEQELDLVRNAPVPQAQPVSTTATTPKPSSGGVIEFRGKKIVVPGVKYQTPAPTSADKDSKAKA